MVKAHVFQLDNHCAVEVERRTFAQLEYDKEESRRKLEEEK